MPLLLFGKSGRDGVDELELELELDEPIPPPPLLLLLLLPKLLLFIADGDWGFC